MIPVENPKVARYIYNLGYEYEIQSAGKWNGREIFCFCFTDIPRIRQLIGLIEDGTLRLS